MTFRFVKILDVCLKKCLERVACVVGIERVFVCGVGAVTHAIIWYVSSIHFSLPNDLAGPHFSTCIG